MRLNVHVGMFLFSTEEESLRGKPAGFIGLAWGLLHKHTGQDGDFAHQRFFLHTHQTSSISRERNGQQGKLCFSELRFIKKVFKLELS